MTDLANSPHKRSELVLDCVKEIMDENMLFREIIQKYYHKHKEDWCVVGDENICSCSICKVVRRQKIL